MALLLENLTKRYVGPDGSAVPVIDAGGYLRTFPHRDGLDGFFAARFLRRAG